MPRPTTRAPLDDASIAMLTSIVRDLTLAEIERIVIEDRLTLHTYRKAAQTLGISQTTIYNRQLKWKAADNAAQRGRDG